MPAGLLRHAGLLRLPPGFFGARSILLPPAFMLLARTRNPERPGLQAPGEWGAPPGLDRAPCSETLPLRCALLAADGSALDVWRSALAGDWARDSPETSATLFVDGHVQVYSGKGRLPMHFVTRRKRSLPAAVSYWLGALGGQPLLCLHKQVDRGEVQAIREDIVPRLESRGLLGPWREGDPPRLTAAFDREGWSPALFAELRAQGIAVSSRVKGAHEERWPEAEFAPAQFVVSAPCSESVQIGQVAERPLDLGAKGPPAREIRFRVDFRLREPGRTGRPRRPQRLAGRKGKGKRQASIMTTHPTPDAARAAGLPRSRRAREKLFQYMRGEFGLDTLPQRGLEDVLAGETAVNPARRSVDRSLRKREEKLERLQRERQRIRDPRRKRKESPKAGPPDPEREAREEARLREIASGIARCEDRIRGLKTAGPQLPTCVLAGDLEGDERPQALPAPLRDLLATLRILACRAETRMAGQPGPGLGRPETARSLLRALFERPASLRPDPAAATLAVRLMPMATQAQDEALARLVAEFNRSETIYPGTDLRLACELLVEPEPPAPSPPLPPAGGSPSAPGTEPPPA